MATNVVSQPSRQFSDTGEEICMLCCEESSAWAVGECEHYVCLTCSARMRLLGGKRECPVCREDNEKVVVLKKPGTFEIQRSYLRDRKNGFYFSLSSLAKSYDWLKAIRCVKCNFSTNNMKVLGDHTRREHELFMCDICVEHLNLFPAEHKLYTRTELVRHRRHGDPDNTSYKGHPPCEFCDERYYSKDELYYHLKKNHFWCHFCEQSTGGQEYYPDYGALKGHFRKEHYLCEEGPCRYEKFVNVFLSKLDFQAHKAKVHTKGLTKTEAKQLRQVDVGFTYARKEQRGGEGNYRNRQYRSGGHHVCSMERDLLERAITESLNEVPVKESDKEPPLSKDLSNGNPSHTTDSGVVHVQPRELVQKLKTEKEKRITTTTKIKTNVDVMPLVKDAPVSSNSVTGIVKRTRFPPGLVIGNIVPSNIPNKGNDKEIEEEEGGDEWPSLSGFESERNTLSTNTTNTKLSSANNAVLIMTNAPGATSLQPPPGLVWSSEDAGFNEFYILDSAKELLEHDLDKVNNFRTLSGQYRKGSISVEEYNDRCGRMFGSDWQTFGRKLASTLPDFNKRNELLATVNKTVINRAPPGFGGNVHESYNGHVNKSGVTTNKSFNGHANTGKVNSRKKKNYTTATSGGSACNNTHFSNGSSNRKGSKSTWQTNAAFPSGRRLNESEFPSLGASVNITAANTPATSWSKIAVK